MAVYAVGTTKAGVNTANTVMWQLRSGATDRVRVKEIGIFVVVAPTTAPSFVLARHLTLGATPTSLTPVARDSAEAAASSVLDTAWGTAPTFTTAGPFMRVGALPVTAGAGIIWTFQDPIVLPVSSGLQIANQIATGATLGSFALYIDLDE